MRIVVDAHEDIAYNAMLYGRNYLHSALAVRRLEAGSGRPPATIGLPDALLGRVAVIFATLFVAPRGGSAQWEPVAYSTPQEAYELAMKQLDYYKRLADESEKLRLIYSAADLDAVLATWDEGTETADHVQGLVILMEGADPIIEPKQFEEWYEQGVRLVGPAWTQTRYSGGTGAPGGLTAPGYDLLDVLANENTILDLSHMAERAYLDAVDAYEGILIASHSNPRKFCDTDRHLSDAMILRLAERDGVMGIVMYNRFLSNTWSYGDPKSRVPFSIVLDAIDYVCQLTGSSAHVGLGSDFDGGFGANAIPEGLDTVMDLWTIGDGLRERGYDEADITAILGGNMLRKLRESLK